MSSNLKSLAKDTAIYGMSSIVGRFLNYLLTPLFTAKIAADSGGYGVVTNIYAITALLQVFLLYGMETGFFRFINKKEEHPDTVYSTVLTSVGASALLFLLLCLSFLTPVAGILGYDHNPEYIGIMAIVVVVDAFLCIPYAYLRYQNKAMKFAAIKLFSIILGIALNLFFLLVCPWLHRTSPELIAWFYNPNYQVGYIFIANLISTGAQLLLLLPVLRGFKYKFDFSLLKRIWSYSFPILILGVVGILNQTMDRIIFPFLFSDQGEARVQLGIYGAATKVAMIMAMFTQAFRYAYEPFVFGKASEQDNRKTYALAMKYFVIFSLLAFLGVMYYMDILRYIISPDYWEGLQVVPIVMAAEIFMGIYFNLSFWYKLIDETRWGAYFSIVGCVTILGLNVALVPLYGYMACAWAGFAGYAVITLLSYFVGQKKYPITYDLKSIGVYTLLTVVLYVLSLLVVPEHIIVRLLFRTFLIAIFIAYAIKKDLPLKQLIRRK